MKYMIAFKDGPLSGPWEATSPKDAAEQMCKASRMTCKMHSVENCSYGDITVQAIGNGGSPKSYFWLEQYDGEGYIYNWEYIKRRYPGLLYVTTDSDGQIWGHYAKPESNVEYNWWTTSDHNIQPSERMGKHSHSVERWKLDWKDSLEKCPDMEDVE